jgi:hypothetical protein
MIPLLLEEMSELKIMKGNRVDHPRKKSKDLADAVCGAVFGAISHTPKEMNLEIDIHTWGTSDKLARIQESMVDLEDRQMPEDVKSFLDNLKLI